MVRLLSVILVFFCVQDRPVMSWEDQYKLSWSDFKGKVRSSGSAVATTASGITFGFSIKKSNTKGVVGFKTNVTAHFYPEESWFISNLANKHVLGHEQLHFDITELYARKFRQRISRLRLSNNIKNELNTIHKTILFELEQMQDAYDSETDFSRNVDNQFKWQEFIKSELQQLEAFKKSKYSNGTQ